VHVGGQNAVDGSGNIVGKGDVAAQTEQFRRSKGGAVEVSEPNRKAGQTPKRRITWPRWLAFGDKTIWDWASLLIVPLVLA